MHAQVYDKFVELAVARAKEEKVGDPFDEATTQGPQVSDEQLKRILNFVSLGMEEGAELLTGGSQHGSKGFFMQPTVFSNVSDEMTIAREEIFGPVRAAAPAHDASRLLRTGWDRSMTMARPI